MPALTPTALCPHTGVSHFKTVFELSGAAARVLPSLTSTQLSFVVEALGSAGSVDAELFGKIADQVCLALCWIAAAFGAAQHIDKHRK